MTTPISTVATAARSSNRRRSKLTPGRCPCGAVIAETRHLCDPCRDATTLVLECLTEALLDEVARRKAEAAA